MSLWSINGGGGHDGGHAKNPSPLLFPHVHMTRQHPRRSFSTKRTHVHMPRQHPRRSFSTKRTHVHMTRQHPHLTKAPTIGTLSGSKVRSMPAKRGSTSTSTFHTPPAYGPTPSIWLPRWTDARAGSQSQQGASSTSKGEEVSMLSTTTANACRLRQKQHCRATNMGGPREEHVERCPQSRRGRGPLPRGYHSGRPG